MASSAQIRKIKTLQRHLNIPDTEYRMALSDYGVESSTDRKFNAAMAGDLIKKLEQIAIKRGDWTPAKKQKPARRAPGHASESQSNMIEGMWAQVSRQETAAQRKIALDKFVRKITGISFLDACGPVHIRKLKRALESMGAVKLEKGEAL